MAGNPDVIAADAVDMELEAMKKDDCSWHPCQVYFSPNGAGLVINYETDGSEDILLSEKEALMRIRARSLPLQDYGCNDIRPGEHVVVNRNSQSENGFFDAEVEKVLRVRHSKRAQCRCNFMIKWLHQDLNDGSLKVPSSSVMRLANKSINNHPTISTFIDAVSLSNSDYSCLSPPLNVVGDFDLDLHDLLEKQIEGIKNSVHGSKKRIRDEILGLDANTHEQVKETKISMPKVRDPEIQVPDNRSPLNPLAARAALASLMSNLPQSLENSLNDSTGMDKIKKLSLETEASPKAGGIVKSLFSTSSSSDTVVVVNQSGKGHTKAADKTNPQVKTRLTRSKVDKVNGVTDDNKERSSSADRKKPTTVMTNSNKRFTRSALNQEAAAPANIQTETLKESGSDDELPSEPKNKKRNMPDVACKTRDSGGNVTVNGGRSYGSKKKSFDLNKQKVRSSPRFVSKT